ncbi:MAG: prepilin-type N-terminal cleavage/methylation domain-containing protein [Lautropia sp.]|nr:prepilin-type N-terminal cleavage/methylation domain-containing protein [Lautropia sp.]
MRQLHWPRIRTRQRGFTLIELLIAVGLLAILAILSWRGLDTVLQSRDRLVTESNGLRSLTLALAQLEEDLLQSWPVRNLGSRLQPMQVLQDQDNGGQTLVLVREIRRRGQATRLQRVVYQVRNGQLARGFSEMQRQPGDDGSVGGAVQSLVWQPILQDVRAMRLRGWRPNVWLTGEQLVAATSPEQPGNNGRPFAAGLNSTTLPDGVRDREETLRQRQAVVGLEVLIERNDGQRFLRTYSLKD